MFSRKHAKMKVREIMKKLISIRLPEDLHYDLKLKTTTEKISIQALIENYIKDYVKDKNSKKKD